MTTQAPEKPGQKPPAAPPEPPKCGHIVNTANGDKPCVKLPGHDSDTGSEEARAQGKGHASRLQTRIEYKPVKADVFASFGAVPTTETAEYGSGRGTGANRYEGDDGAQQKIVDEHVAKAYAEWVKAGKPKLSFNEAIAAGLASRYFMTPGDEESVRAKLRSAARYHDVGLQIAKLKKHESGKHMLYWRALDLQKHQKPATPPVTSTGPAAPAPPAAPAA